MTSIKARTLLLGGGLLAGLLVLTVSWAARAQPMTASYYGTELEGSPTASGAPYDPYSFTAAHRTLPFGTVLEVCYDGCVQVSINDRNPNSAADIDLSLVAADDIGIIPDGLDVVDAEVVE